MLPPIETPSPEGQNRDHQARMLAFLQVLHRVRRTRRSVLELQHSHSIIHPDARKKSKR